MFIGHVPAGYIALNALGKTRATTFAPAFLTHWTFALELSLCAIAAFLFWRRRRT